MDDILLILLVIALINLFAQLIGFADGFQRLITVLVELFLKLRD